jgi:hypothetical protein
MKIQNIEFEGVKGLNGPYRMRSWGNVEGRD